MDYKYSGIILNKTDIGETDRIYTILTYEEGKIRILGKGIRRPNARLAGHLEPITHSEIFAARSRGMGKLTGSIAVENFSKIKSEIESLKVVSYVFGILDRTLSEQEKDARTFELTKEYLETLEGLDIGDKQEKRDILTLGFMFKLLNNLGYGIETSKCMICAKNLKPENNYFSSEEGGILCQNCQDRASDKIQIRKESIKLMRVFEINKIKNLTKLSANRESLNNLKIILDDFFNRILR